MSSLVSITALNGYYETTQSLDFDPQALLVACNIDPQLLHGQEGYISFAQFAKLLELTAERANCPHFGLLMAEKRHFSVFGILGLLVEKSPDIRTAMREWQRFGHVYSGAITINFLEQHQSAIYTYQIVDDAPATRQAIDLALNSATRMLSLIVNQKITPSAIYLSHSGGSQPQGYRKLFGAPVTFNHELNAAVFDRKLLDMPLQHYHAETLQQLRRRLAKLSEESEQSIETIVHKLIVTLLPTGYCSRKEIARQLMMSENKLHYLLAEHHITFKALVAKTRHSMAKLYLQQSDTSLLQLCQLLGYSEQSTFTRAFKSWFGVSPAIWKKQQKLEARKVI